MKSTGEIKQNRKIEVLNIGFDGLSGIIHITGLRKCTVVASWAGGWEHVSVCPENRCPTWDEMCEIKDMFWRDDETVIQIHPARRDYVNFMQNCLHLWKPINQDIPLPPKLFV